MTDADKLRLARDATFRDLLGLIFGSDSLAHCDALAVLADHLEESGHHEAADAIRGKFRAGDAALQVVDSRKTIVSGPVWPIRDSGNLKSKRSARRVRVVVTLEGLEDQG